MQYLYEAYLHIFYYDKPIYNAEFNHGIDDILILGL